MAQMPNPEFDIAPCGEGYIIEVRWPDSTIERMPGLFSTEQAAHDCLASESFIRWLRERSLIRCQDIDE
jgi:hypothetical protein